MKPALALLLLFCALCTASAQSVLSRLDRTVLYGRECVRLNDWADATGMDLRWIQRERELVITNKYTRLSFVVDNRKIEVNGTSLWLSAPIAYKNGAAYIAVLDLTTAVHPVLYPVRNSKRDEVKTICLDPGHGGKDPGNHDRGAQEKKYTLLLAEELRTQLQTAGFKVIMTRSSDRFVDLPDRPEYAERYGADLFVSLHFNGSENNNGARGVETYCLTPANANSTNTQGGDGSHTGKCTGNQNDSKNMLLAYQVQRSLVRTLRAEDRGVRRARFAVLRTAEMPGILVEGGFMSDPSEAKKIYDAGYRRQMAKGIVDAIQAYKRLVER